MPDYKTVWSFFSAGSKGGSWSETWYRFASTLAQAATFTSTLLQARLRLLNQLNTLQKIRVSEVLNPRVTTVVNVRQNGIPGFPAVAPAPIDSAVVVTVSSSIQPATRRWWCRGWDVGQAYRDETTGNDVFSSTLISQVADWLTVAGIASFEVLPLQKATAVGFTPFNVTAVDGTAANGQSILTLPAGHTILKGDTILCYQFSKKELPALSGKFTVLDTGVSTVTIPYSTPENIKLAGVYGKVRKVGYISGALIDANISGPQFLGGRKTKSPFTGSRGARSANRKLRLSP